MLRFALTLKSASILTLTVAFAAFSAPTMGQDKAENDKTTNDKLGNTAKKAEAQNRKPLEYEAALKKSQKEEKPLLILVGARWCASCEIMKNETIEPMKKAGELDNVIYTHVDKDKRPELAEQLMKGSTLPQVVLFSKRSGAWKRFSLTGMQSRNRMTELFGRAKIAIRNKSQLR